MMAEGGTMKKMKLLFTLFGVLLLLCICGFLYAKYIEVHRLVVRDVFYQGDVSQEVKVVQFSDTHFKHDYPADKAEDIVDKINEQNPDIVIFSGDLLDNYAKDPAIIEDLRPYLKNIEANYGKYAVFGNHDIGGGAIRIYKDFMESCGFVVLRNESAEIPELDIALLGIDDVLSGYEDIHLSEQDLQPYQILISHEPDVLSRMDLLTIDMSLSGHTHGGQVYLPFISKKFLPIGGQLYRKGLYTLENTKLYVSSGIGTTHLSLRFGNPPEIIVHTISPIS